MPRGYRQGGRPTCPFSIKALMSVGVRWAHSAARYVCGMFSMTHAMAEASSSSAPLSLTNHVNLSAKLGENAAKLKSPSTFLTNLSIAQVISQAAANQPMGGLRAVNQPVAANQQMLDN